MYNIYHRHTTRARWPKVAVRRPAGGAGCVEPERTRPSREIHKVPLMVQQGRCFIWVLTGALLYSGDAFTAPFRRPRTRLSQLPQRLESTSSDRSGSQGSFPERSEGLADWSSRKAINLRSPGFANLRAAGAPFVDKTSAIADLLCGEPPPTFRAFFSRPRKFGKSLTLDIMRWMLTAGKLPEGVQPWRNYEPVDVKALFGGLEVYQRLRRRDPSLGGLLQRAHFVIPLDLGEATSGAKLEAAIISRLASIAGGACDKEAKADVLAAPNPGDALSRLIDCIPAKVPIAVLVDEYDAGIVRDVGKQRWEAAESGIEALQSLFMTSKGLYQGGRIEHFVVTGVARFARTSLFSGANNFGDLTNDPLLSAAIGFSEGEIRSTFGPELERLGRDGMQGRTADDALHELARWYNGYCFDRTGEAPCFNPYPVLVALANGKLTSKEMEGASGTNWLGLTPADVTQGVVVEVLETSAVSVEHVNVDLADLRARRVDVRALLLQTGLLTLSRKASSAEEAGLLECVVPNQYARQSLVSMLGSAWPRLAAAEMGPDLVRAVRERDRQRFQDTISAVIENIPEVILKRPAPESASLEAKQVVREAPYHVAVWLPLFLCLPRDVAHVEVEYTVRGGRPDVVLELLPVLPDLPEEVWIIEVGVGVPAKKKLEQVRGYMANAKFRGRKVVGAACTIAKGGANEWMWAG